MTVTHILMGMLGPPALFLLIAIYAFFARFTQELYFKDQERYSLSYYRPEGIMWPFTLPFWVGQNAWHTSCSLLERGP